MDEQAQADLSLGSIIEPSRVLCNVEARSKKHSLDILSELLATAVPDLSQGEVFDSLVHREKVGSTALDGGIAIPHGCIEGIDRVYGAFLKLSEPVDYDTVEGEPVDLLCGLLLPTDGRAECGQQLQEAAKLFLEPGFLEQLRSSTSSSGLFEMLTQPSQALSASA